MILVDVNLLVYAHVEGMHRHAEARRWLDDALSGTGPVGLPWHSLLGFVRLVTNPRVFAAPHDSRTAWSVVEHWLDADPVWTPGPTDRHREVFSTLVERVRPSGNLVPDTHLAAIAIEHGLTLMTADRGFARFPDLKWANPIDPSAPEPASATP